MILRCASFSNANKIKWKKFFKIILAACDITAALTKAKHFEEQKKRL